MSPFAIVVVALSMSADAFTAAPRQRGGARPAAAWRGGALRPDLRPRRGGDPGGRLESSAPPPADNWIAFAGLIAIGVKILVG